MKLDDFLSTKAKCIKQFDPRFFNSWDVGETYDISITIQVTDKNNDDICFEPQDFIEHFEPVIDEPKPTAEIETTQNSVDAVTASDVLENQFKVGDPVYIFGYPKIYIVREIYNTVVKLNDSAVGHPHERITLATPENHALLSQLYPHIEFEAPPKELTGSDLCRAMLDKGWQYVPCYISDSSDTHALERQNRNIVIIVGTHKDHPSFFTYGLGKSFIPYAVPFDPRTGEVLTQAVLDES